MTIKIGKGGLMWGILLALLLADPDTFVVFLGCLIAAGAILVVFVYICVGVSWIKKRFNDFKNQIKKE